MTCSIWREDSTMKPTKPHDVVRVSSPVEGSESLARHLRTSLAATALLTLACCVVYPFLVWGLGQLLYPVQANGSLVAKDGGYTTRAEEVRGSALLSQGFAASQYFHPRPSAAGAGHDAAASSGSNLGPLSDKLLSGALAKDEQGKEALAFDGIRLRTLRYAMENGISFQSSIPLDRFRGKDGQLDEVEL